jgi:dTDP-glucose 4,6-dehydratase
MNVLIAGGAGFIGSHLAHVLVARGDRVVVVDNLTTGRKENVADLICDDDRFELIVGDVAATELVVPRRVPTFDVVIHLASPASPVAYTEHPVATLAANSDGTANLLGWAHRDRARFIYASSSEVYGDPLEHPQAEEYWGNVNPIGPRSMYDEGKRFSEALIRAATLEEPSLKTAIARIFNTYGPGMTRDDGRVIPAFIDAALRGEPLIVTGTGEQTRCFLFIDDLIVALMHLVDSERIDNALGTVVNIGATTELTMTELADRVVRVVGSSSPITYVPARHDDPTRRAPVIDRMTSRFGWVPRVGLDEGLAQTVRWFREQH